MSVPWTPKPETAASLERLAQRMAAARNQPFVWTGQPGYRFQWQVAWRFGWLAPRARECDDEAEARAVYQALQAAALQGAADEAAEDTAREVRPVEYGRIWDVKLERRTIWEGPWSEVSE